MGKVVMAGGGGGVASPDCTATANLVVAGKTYLGNDTNDDVGTGTLPDQTAKDSLGGINSSYPNVAIHKGTQPQFTQPTGSGADRMFAIRPDRGYWNGDTYVAIPSQRKNVTPAITQQVISAESGKILENVTVGAIPNQKNYGYGGFGQGDDYYSVNALPEGYYRKMTGGNWEPEARILKATLRAALGITADKIKKGAVIAGITGTWEGYVAGNGEIYNRGALDSSAGFAVVGEVSSGVGTLGYQTTYMLLTKYYGIMLYTGKKYECTGYSKLNFTVSSDSSRDNVSWYAVLFTGDAKAGSTYADGILKKVNVGYTNSVTEQTFSVDISDIKTACHIGIIMDSAASGPGYEKGRVFKIWLS